MENYCYSFPSALHSLELEKAEEKGLPKKMKTSMLHRCCVSYRQNVALLGAGEEKCISIPNIARLDDVSNVTFSDLYPQAVGPLTGRQLLRVPLKVLSSAKFVKSNASQEMEIPLLEKLQHPSLWSVLILREYFLFPSALGLC